MQFKNKEQENEVSDTRTELMNKLSCIIDNQSNPISTLHEGIRCGLEEEVEKFSESLQRDSLWLKSSKF